MSDDTMADAASMTFLEVMLPQADWAWVAKLAALEGLTPQALVSELVREWRMNDAGVVDRWQ